MRINLSDNVFMGNVDVQQNILNTDECPSCSASNVRVMKCQDKQCTSEKFCELCHTMPRFSEGHFERFDSGHGLGPFCAKCLISTRNQYEDKKRLEREKTERERVERETERIRQQRDAEQKHRDKMASWERERIEKHSRHQREKLELERERLELETEGKMNSLEIFLHRRNMKWAYLCAPLYFLGLHRLRLSRISGLVYPLTIISMNMLEKMNLIPDFKWGFALLILLIYDLFQIPKWSREKSRKEVLKYALSPSFQRRLKQHSEPVWQTFRFPKYR